MTDEVERDGDREIDLSLVRMGTVLLRHRRLIIVAPVVAFLVVAVGTLVLPTSYSAESIFVPQSRPSGGGAELGAIASQFGFELGGGNRPAESPQFYAGLISTVGILREIAESEFAVDRNGDGVAEPPASFPSLIGVDGENPADSVREAIRHLEDEVSATVDQTGRVHVRTRAPWPELAIAMNERILEAVTRFNREARQSNASAEREFVEERLREARQELESAEMAYTEFLETNRRIQGSPQLMAEASRLDRQVQFRQQVFTSLAQAYEKARIDEVRNTPLVTMVERPADTVRPTRGSFLMNGIFAAFIMFLLAIGVAFVREYARRQRIDRPTTYGEFVSLSREAREDLRAPLRVFGRRS